jgi:uncharacterized protein (TIGR00299 family) protein
MKVLYLDCFSGAAGDMLLGALLDAGLPLDALRRALGSLAIGDLELVAERVVRSGISATKFRVLAHSHPPHPPHSPHTHHETHPPHQAHHAHRTLAEIERLIDGSALSDAGKARAVALFRRLGEAEADIHEIPLEKVHLHEVGALDSIVDIVGTVFGMEWFGADRVVASPLNVGGGTVECAHGTFPVPAPATLRLLAGVPVYSRGPLIELVTPTGALLVTGFADGFGPMPAMTVERIGYGAGDRDLPGSPNVLRVVTGAMMEVPAGLERVLVLEFEVDDMNPQLFGPLMERLYAAGALDVYYVPIQMKKSRPGTLVTVVAPPDRCDALSAVVFRESTTIGLRQQEVLREALAREVVTVPTPLGPVRFKVARRGGEIANAAPEFEDCAALAARTGASVKDVQALAMRAWLEGLNTKETPTR